MVGETYSLIPPLVVRLIFKEGARRQRGGEPRPRILYKWFRAKKAIVWQVFKAFNNGDNKTDPIH